MIYNPTIVRWFFLAALGVAVAPLAVVALSAPGAVPEALVNSVQCSREARRALKRGVVPLQWICADRTDVERAARLESLFALRPARPARGDAEFNAYNAASRTEFVELYAAGGLDPANNELSATYAALVLRGLGLLNADAASLGFADLGSSCGSLVLAAAAVTPCARCAGVELSYRSDATARAALAQLRSHDDSAAAAAAERSFSFGEERVSFFRGDLRAFDRFAEFDVLFCAIRGVASRPKVLDALLRALCVQDGRADGTGSKRLVCAGFGLDLAGKDYESAVHFTKAYAIDAQFLDQNHETNDGHHDRAVNVAAPLYGDDKGPRVLCEYTLRCYD